MRTNKKFSAAIEWLIAVVLIIAVWKFSDLSYGSFSPMKAHQQSERTFHYGPSELVRTIDLDGVIIYLSRYKDWISENTVKRKIFKWYTDSENATPIDFSKQVTYSYVSSNDKKNLMIIKLYGYVIDSQIASMILAEEDESKTLKYNLDEKRMFIFYWKENEQTFKTRYIKGLDKDGKVIYEQKI